MRDLSSFEAVLRMALALGLGAIIGAERERGGHAAGMRTHAAVCLGSAIFMLVSAYSFPELRASLGPRFDPTRIAAQVVSGIGFLGGGIIFTQRGTIRGLTTAAALWVVAGLGLAAGAGLYFVSCGGTVLMLVVLAALKPLEERLFPQRPRLVLLVHPQEELLSYIRAALDAGGVRPRALVIRPGPENQESVELRLPPMPAARLERLMRALRGAPGLVTMEVRGVDALDGEAEGEG